MNMWGFTPAVFPQLYERFQRFLKQHGSDLKAECYLPSSVNDLIQAGQARVKVLRSSDSWFGVTYREDHPRVVRKRGPPYRRRNLSTEAVAMSRLTQPCRGYAYVRSPKRISKR